MGRAVGRLSRWFVILAGLTGGAAARRGHASASQEHREIHTLCDAHHIACIASVAISIAVAVRVVRQSPFCAGSRSASISSALSSAPISNYSPVRHGPSHSRMPSVTASRFAAYLANHLGGLYSYQ